MINIQYYLILQFIVYKLCSGFNKQLYECTNIQSNKNRLLVEESYCLTYDRDMNDNLICIKCQDSFLLPDCKECYLGYVKKGNQCLKCGQGQLNCENNTNELFCFKGYTNVNGNCVCNPLKQKRAFWCTTGNEVYYLSVYQPGQIRSIFSSQIIINEVSDLAQYEFNKDNCKVMTNKSDYMKIQSTMSCKIDPDKKNEFLISLETSDIADEYYKIVPKFDIQKLSFKTNAQVIQALSIEYQKTTLQQNQYVNHNINSIQTNLCSTKNVIYRFSHGNNIFPQDQFVVEGFKSTLLKFQITQENLSTPSEKASVQNGLNSYPSEMKFQLEKKERAFEFTYYEIKFNCNLPFGMQSTGKFQIQKVIGKLRFQIGFKNSDYFPNYLKMIYQVNNQVNQQNNLFREGEIFNVNYKLLDNFNNVIIDYPQIQQKMQIELIYDDQGYIKSSFLFLYQILNLEKVEYLDSYYQLQVQITDFQELNTVSNKILLTYKDQNESTRIQILNKDQLINFNPRKNYRFVGDFSIQQDLQQIQDIKFQWYFGARLNITTIEGKLFKVNQWQPSELSPQLWEDILDYSSSYQLFFQAQIIIKDKPTQTYTDVAFISTIKASLIVNYDNNYNQGLSNYEMLSFYLEYDEVAKLRRNTYNHFFKLRYFKKEDYLSKDFNIYDVKYSGQIEPQFYFEASKYITQISINDVEYLQFIFYVNDLFGNLIASSKIYTFKPKTSPDCFQFQENKTPDEVFAEKIKLTVDFCNQKDGFFLYYQFFYYNSQDLKNQEDQNPQKYTRKYLTKFQISNYAETVLPPGQLILAVYIKDQYESRQIKFINMINQSSDFTQQKYEGFLNSQNLLIDNYAANNQFEEELCTISMILEAIETYESSNQLKVDKSQLKMKLKSRLISLPFLISSNPLVFDLQEFILRCLDRLYKTQDFPDSILNRFDDLNNIVKKKIDEIKTFNTFLPESKATYQRSMKITFQLVIEYIKNISKIPQDLIPWNQKQIDSLFNIQHCISQTLNVNQGKIVHDGEFVTVEIQKVDSQILIKEYMQSLNIPLDREYDQKTRYNVLIQNWKENIYQLDPAYIDQVSPYYSKVSSEIRLELDRIYPAINPYYIMETDETIEYSRRRRNLEYVESNNLVLPDDALLNYQFKEIQGPGSVVCTQKISSVWSKKQCKTVVEKTGNTYKVSCYCSSPSYTTLIYDIESLFDNENVDNIFSSSGIENLFSLENWYEYAAIYTIIVMNGVLIGSLIFASKLDKIFGLGNPSVAAAILVTNEIKMQQITEENLINNDENKNSEDQKSSSNKNKKQEKEDKEEIDDQQAEIQSRHSILIKSQNSLIRNQKVTQYQSEPAIKETNQQEQKLEEKSSIDNQQNNKEEKAEKQNVQKKNRNDQLSVNDENDLYDKDQQNIPQSPSLTPLINEKTPLDTMTEQLDDKVENQEIEDEKKRMKDQKRKEIEKKKQENEKKLKNIKEKAEEYFNKLSIVRGVATFHILFQIFLVPNKKLSRTFRFCVYYSKLIWVLAINATFGSNITLSQVIILSVISSSSFAIYSKILELLQFHKYARYGSYFLCFCFLIFCYYATFISISSSSSSNSNMWMLSYFCTLLVNIIIIGSLTSAIKFFITKKLLQKLKVNNFLFVITSADIIFEMFE